MATTKIRKKTPMRNKPCMWRRMSEKTLTVEKELLPSGVVNEVIREKRNGRMLKRAGGGMNHQGFLLPIHVWLFRSAGIPTPVFDKQYKGEYTNTNGAASNPDAEITDAEIINEGAINAA